MKYCIIVLLLYMCQNVFAQYPDGTVILSSKKGLIGRIAQRLTGGDQYTHIGIVIDGKIYESDWPRATTRGISGYGKPRSTNDFYVPLVPYSQYEVDRMRSYAQSQLGKPYQLRNYFNPRSPKTYGTWCSPFVGNTLNASGRYHFSTRQIYEPQNIVNHVNGQYQFKNRIVR